jgi:trehalose/maltose hydrolase-like predicted phosphorylase
MPDNLLVSDVRDKALQAHVANGHVGLQGSPSGLAAARSFMVGVSDLTPNDHYRMACLPAWNSVGVCVGGDTLEAAFGRGDVDGYRQTLDIGTARLVTEYRTGVGGVGLRVRVETWLSRADRFLACQRVVLSADRTAKAVVSVGIRPWPAPTERYPFRSLVWPHPDYPKDYECGFYNKRMSYAWRPGHMDVVRMLAHPADACWAMSAVAAGCGPAVGVAVATRVAGTSAGTSASTPSPTRGDADTVGEYELSLGSEPTVVEMYVAFSRDGLADGLAEVAIRRAVAARARGINALWTDHAAVWAELWRGDILVEGDETIARQARADLFQLYQNQPVDDRYPIQIMGIASPGYYGGCFWDCDVYTLPAMLPFGPERTLGTLQFRKRTLPAAMRNATRPSADLRFPRV